MMDASRAQAIRDNYRDVLGRIEAAALRAERCPEYVTLVAVTKGRPLDEVRVLYDEGARLFGENRIQEAVEKIPHFENDIVWHLIGHLQRNKSKVAVRHFGMIHSVDSIRLGDELSRQCERHEVDMPVLLEVNVSGEESKYGLAEQELDNVVNRSSEWPRLHVEGLMTMAPFVDDPEEVRPVFRHLRELRDRLRDAQGDESAMPHLSMGMTNDYEVAVEEGATLVRVGSALFKE